MNFREGLIVELGFMQLNLGFLLANSVRVTTRVGGVGAM